MSDHPEDSQPTPTPAPVCATLEGKAERAVIPEQGGEVYIEYRLRVSPPPPAAPDAAKTRKPLAISLVLDRSGSMSHGKLDTAKYATSAVLDRLDERDLVAVTVFDNRVDEVQSLAAASADLKEMVRAELARIQPRGGTALFDGWQRGAHALADAKENIKDRLAHCFLLTDGQANAGETDPETIATMVGTMQETHGVGTSTFGIGQDYSEEVLGPMSVAGGGQFQHIDEPGEIARMFVSQLGELLSVALPRVRLELDMPSGVKARVISAYWAHPGADADGRVTTVGDLLAGEQRSIVFALTFPSGQIGAQVTVRGRLVWATETGEDVSAWDAVMLTYATAQDYGSSQRDSGVYHLRIRESASHTTLAAVSAFKTGHDLDYYQDEIDHMIALMTNDGAAEPDEPDLRETLRDLRAMREQLAAGHFDPVDMKRMYMMGIMTSRGTAARNQAQRRNITPARGSKPSQGADSPADTPSTSDADDEANAPEDPKEP